MKILFLWKRTFFMNENGAHTWLVFSRTNPHWLIGSFQHTISSKKSFGPANFFTMHEFGMEEWWHTVIVNDPISAKQQPDRWMSRKGAAQLFGHGGRLGQDGDPIHSTWWLELQNLIQDKLRYASDGKMRQCTVFFRNEGESYDEDEEACYHHVW